MAVPFSASCFRIANIMSCLRSAEAASISRLSAKASNSAGVLRLSSWRFIGGRIVYEARDGSSRRARGNARAAERRKRSLRSTEILVSGEFVEETLGGAPEVRRH